MSLLAEASAIGDAAGVLAGLLNIGCAGFFIRWLTTSVIPKLEQIRNDMFAEREKMIHSMNRLTESVATLVIINEISTERMKERERAKIAEIAKEDEYEQTRRKEGH